MLCWRNGRPNWRLTIDRLKRERALAPLVASGQLGIVGDRYDLETGMVDFTR